MIEPLILMLAAHALCDYPLQGDWLSKAKNPTLILTPTGLAENPPPPMGRKGEIIWPLALASHALIHATAVYLITHSWTLFALEFVAHAAIDYGKCRGGFGYNTDQWLHVLCKLVWAGFLLSAPIIGVPLP